MKNRIFCLIIAIFLIMLGAAIISEGAVLKKQITNFKYQNQEVYLGTATITGDGTELNTTVETTAENDLVIRTDTETSFIDLYITYSMTCNGLTDSGVTTLLIQVNGETKGHNESATLNFKEGDLFFENLEVKWGDVLSFEIGAAYTNGFPPFVESDLAVGGGIISKKARIQSMPNFTIFRLFKSLQNIFSKNIIY